MVFQKKSEKQAIARPQHRGMLHALELTTDGGCLVAGDGYVMKLDSLANIVLDVPIMAVPTIHFEAFPNPSKRQFQLQSNYTHPIDAKLFSSQGILQRSFNQLSPPYQIATEGLSSGYYILEIQYQNQRLSIPIILTP